MRFKSSANIHVTFWCRKIFNRSVIRPDNIIRNFSTNNRLKKFAMVKNVI